MKVCFVLLLIGIKVVLLWAALSLPTVTHPQKTDENTKTIGSENVESSVPPLIEKKAFY